MDDIRLPKIGEQKPKSLLPRGVYMVKAGENLIFVRRWAGRLLPLPQTEQEQIARKLGLIDG